MNEIDRYLLDQAPNRRVAVLPTAAGREPDYAKWINQGVKHFAALGAEPAGVAAIDRRSVADRQLLAPIDQAGVIYFSGGDPGYLLSALRGSPLWRAVHQRYLAGAVLVGASAGAMVLGRYTPANIYAVAETGVKPDWQPALDLAPYNVIPHYDYIAREDPAVLAAVLKAAPAEVTNGLIGIDEDTALIIGKPTETVMGRGGVHRL